MQYYLLYIYTRSAASARSRNKLNNITIIFSLNLYLQKKIKKKLNRIMFAIYFL